MRAVGEGDAGGRKKARVRGWQGLGEASQPARPASQASQSGQSGQPGQPDQSPRSDGKICLFTQIRWKALKRGRGQPTRPRDLLGTWSAGAPPNSIATPELPGFAKPQTSFKNTK